MKRAQGGFTLIELAIVLAGLILTAVFLPAVQSNSNQNVECTSLASTCEMPVGTTAGR